MLDGLEAIAEELADRSQDPDSFGGDLRPDAVARKNRDRELLHLSSRRARRRSKRRSGFLQQGSADLIESEKQHLPPIGFYLESGLKSAPSPRTDCQIRDRRSARIRRGGPAAEQRIHHGVGQRDRQQSILTAVAVENVGKRRGDDRAETVIGQRPRCMFAGRAASEVGSGEKNGRAACLGPIELELGVSRPSGR